MLNGSIWDKIPQFALPVATTGILKQLFNASDLAIVGNFAAGTPDHRQRLRRTNFHRMFRLSETPDIRGHHAGLSDQSGTGCALHLLRPDILPSLQTVCSFRLNPKNILLSNIAHFLTQCQNRFIIPHILTQCQCMRFLFIRSNGPKSILFLNTSCFKYICRKDESFMPAGSPERTNARKEEIINACEQLYQTQSFREITIKEIGQITSCSRTSKFLTEMRFMRSWQCLENFARIWTFPNNRSLSMPFSRSCLESIPTRS